MSKKSYQYLCPHCGEVHLYTPRKSPRLYFDPKLGSVMGPSTTSCCKNRNLRKNVAILVVPHFPQIPLEFIHLAKYKKGKRHRMYQIVNNFPLGERKQFSLKLEVHFDSPFNYLDEQKLLGYLEKTFKLKNLVLSEFIISQEEI